MTGARQRIRQVAANRRRSVFRDEFYKDSSSQKRAASARKKPAGGGRGAARLPLWVTASGFGLLFCLIAIGGSSAIIWLRKLGALFGVHWVGE